MRTTQRVHDAGQCTAKVHVYVDVMCERFWFFFFPRQKINVALCVRSAVKIYIRSLDAVVRAESVKNSAVRPPTFRPVGDNGIIADDL